MASNARLQHSGVYVANGHEHKGTWEEQSSLQGYRAQDGLYGPRCDFVCPKCQNGGVCHDITGQCICPPGFSGEICDMACGDDFFGKHCNRRCSDTNQDGKDKTCRRILMCLPDPYGCSCGTGFYGPFCNQKPNRPPQKVTIDNSSTSEIVIRWTNPGKETWQCWSVNVVLEANGEPIEFNLTESSSTPANVYKITVTPYTAVAIRLRLRTPDNKNSSWTRIWRVTSAEDDPWETELRRRTVTWTSITYRDLLPYTRYQVKVYAENGAGRSSMFAFLNFTTLSALLQPWYAITALSFNYVEDVPMRSVPRRPEYWLSKYTITITSTDQACSQNIALLLSPLHYCFYLKVSYALSIPMHSLRLISLLRASVYFSLQICAKNIGTDYSPYSEEVEVETREMGKLNSSLSHTYNVMLTESWTSKSVLLNSSDSLEFYLRGLFPGSTYLVCVQAKTSAGFGNATCKNFSTKASSEYDH
ncbi:hypothetical protein HPB50_021738 [Hyalomma asiaticum]|uniref:Uncharacterized protein n=1 Tax=Hyalomma asiaticum TaxID=266040 RepID=A0ACB7T423_HYAAI|nr:hypothetical protein HPB50_021738 [Hyalomma asiaticum]